MHDCHRLCFDVNLLYDSCNSEVHPSIRLQGGTPDYFQATFKAYNIMTNKDGISPGWRRVCAPVKNIDSNGNLPSNENGYWIMGSQHNTLSGFSSDTVGSTPPNSTWPFLLSNIAAIILPVDFTGMPTERIGYDNICMENMCTAEVRQFCVQKGSHQRFHSPSLFNTADLSSHC